MNTDLVEIASKHSITLHAPAGSFPVIVGPGGSRLEPGDDDEHGTCAVALDHLSNGRFAELEAAGVRIEISF